MNFIYLHDDKLRNENVNIPIAVKKLERVLTLY